MNPARTVGLDDASRAERLLFFAVAVVAMGLAVGGLRYPSAVGGLFSSTFDFVLNYFGWWFILLCGVITLFLTWFALSRYGHLRLGGPDAEPEFDRFSWLAMVFTVGYSISVLFWGVAEPVSIVTSPPATPPVGGVPIETLALAFMYLHDVLPGLIAWYLPFALAFGLVVRGEDPWKVSSVLRPFLDRTRHPFVFWAVDFVTLVAIVGGLATSLGFIGTQLASLVAVVYGVRSTAVTVGLFALVAVVFVADVWAGLRGGIRNAARVAVLANLALTAVLLVVGPTRFILELGLDAVGVWLAEMPRLLFYTQPVQRNLWPQYWTSFWWAWWAAWGVFVGAFVARVSEGRTVREVFVGLCVAPASLLVVQHAVLGGIALAPGNVDPIASALESRGNAAALSVAVDLLPYSEFVGLFVVVALVGYLVTSLDSAVYMLSGINLGTREPNARNRATWGLLMVVVGVMTVYVGGGTQVLESFSTTLALPFTALYLVVLGSVYVVARRRFDREFRPMEERPRRAEDRDAREGTTDSSR